MEVEPHDRDDQVAITSFRHIIRKLSYLQGTEVVSAKLFISYMGTNTAKDFKVREKG